MSNHLLYLFHRGGWVEGSGSCPSIPGRSIEGPRNNVTVGGGSCFVVHLCNIHISDVVANMRLKLLVHPCMLLESAGFCWSNQSDEVKKV